MLKVKVGLIWISMNVYPKDDACTSKKVTPGSPCHQWCSSDDQKLMSVFKWVRIKPLIPFYCLDTIGTREPEMTSLDTAGSKTKIRAHDLLKACLWLLFLRRLVAVQGSITQNNYSLPLLSRHLLLTTKITEYAANHELQFQLFLQEPYAFVLWNALDSEQILSWWEN